MLAYLLSSIWASPAQTLVKTVNVAGRHGIHQSLSMSRRVLINLLSAMNKMELLANCVEIVDDRQERS